MSRLRRPLALVVGLLALAALVVGAWSAAQFRSATLGRPWFAAPDTLVVAPDGTLYVGLGEREVQVYAADGRPRSAWYREESGPFRLRVAADGEGVEVVSADDRVVRRGPDAERLAATREPGAYARLDGSRREGRAADGTRYGLREEGLVRIDSADVARVLVPAPPSPLRRFGPSPLLPITVSLLAALLGLVLVVVLARRPGEAA